MFAFDTAPSLVGNDVHDVEKQESSGAVDTPHRDGAGKHTLGSRLISKLVVKDGEVYKFDPEKNPKWYQRLLDAGVEENGIKPVPLEYRTVTQYSNLFTVFFTCLLNLLP